MATTTRPPRPEAWEGLDTHREDLERYLVRRGCPPHEVDDVVQETLLRAARYRRTLGDPARLRPWLLRIAANALTDRRRSELRRRRTTELDARLDPASDGDALPGPGDDEEVAIHCDGEWVERETVLAALRRVWPGLREDDRRLLAAFYAGPGTCRDAAARCDLPLGTVKVRLYRARRRLGRGIVAELGRRRREVLWRVGA